MSQAIFGRDIKHVTLLHIGTFETIMLPHLLELLQERGLTMITLPKAESDPAYALHPDLPAHWDGLFLDMLEGKTHVTLRNDSNARLNQLDALCR
jgi:peptidoglycan-N-acetylglucosamine deacetylase